jgi:Lysine-specific metallo-endopeptidase
MGYKPEDLYSARHAAMLETLKSKDFPSGGDWGPVISSARGAVGQKGFDVGKYAACESIRKVVANGVKAKIKPAASILAGAGGTLAAATGAPLSAPLTKRMAALEVLRRLWLLKKWGSHKLWVLSLPMKYGNWPEADFAGKQFSAISDKLNDEGGRFSIGDQKHLSSATQQGLKWIHKAMIVAGAPDKAKHKVILKRWFADANTTDEDLRKAAKTLAAGLLKMSNTIKSTFLLMTDMPLDRNSADAATTNAFVFSDEPISVIYVERAFFGTHDTWKDLKNWTRIVVHELSHRDGKTDDHRYRHNSAGLKPSVASFKHAKAISNADSWAIFCMDCAGEMTDADYKKVKVE